MNDDLSWDGSSLREETRNVQEHVFELLISLVVVSILLGLAISLFASWLFQVLNQQLLPPIIIGCVVIAAILIFSYLFRLLTTIKEFHKEIEIPLPLFVSKQDVEVIRVRYYDRVTDLLHAALARRSNEERKRIAQSIQSLHGNNTSARHEISEFVLELMQLLFATQVVRGSARLLGSQAPFHKFREVSQLQSSTTKSDCWS
jgi:flagellar biosynthesis protein FliQ